MPRGSLRERLAQQPADLQRATAARSDEVPRVHVVRQARDLAAATRRHIAAMHEDVARAGFGNDRGGRCGPLGRPDGSGWTGGAEAGARAGAAVGATDAVAGFFTCFFAVCAGGGGAELIDAGGADAAAGGGGAAAGSAVLAGCSAGRVARTAVWQPGDSFATFFCRHISASLPPGWTPEQFDMKSERQLERMALCCAEVGCAAALCESTAIASAPRQGPAARRKNLVMRVPVLAWPVHRSARTPPQRHRTGSIVICKYLGANCEANGLADSPHSAHRKGGGVNHGHGCWRDRAVDQSANP